MMIRKFYLFIAFFVSLTAAATAQVSDYQDINTLPDSYVKGNFDTLSADHFSIPDFDIQAVYKLPDGYFLVNGYGGHAKNEYDNDWGDRILLLNPRKQIIYRSKGNSDLYYYQPFFYTCAESGRIVIACHMGFEYFFGADIFVYEEGNIQYTGQLDIEPYDALQEKNLIDMLHIRGDNDKIEFVLDADSLLFNPGGPFEQIIDNTANRHSYILKNEQLYFGTPSGPLLLKPPATGIRPEDFVLNDWKIVLQAEGDLNKDNRDDIVLVIENTQKANILLNEGLGADTLNCNPRMMIILFQKENGTYKLADYNHAGFIPPPNDSNTACLADPLMNDGGMRIEKGVLKVDLQYWLSCGSWYSSNACFLFRFQNENMQLIGFDYTSYHRASGDKYKKSINFSTQKIVETSGGNMFDDNENRPKDTWRSFTRKWYWNLKHCRTDITETMLQL